MSYIRWLFWELVYLFRRTPKDLGGFLIMSHRRRRPWWKFKPNLFHSDAGSEWHIYFEDAQCYTASRIMLMVDLHIAFDGSRVTGLNIWDESLEKAKKEYVDEYERKCKEAGKAKTGN